MFGDVRNFGLDSSKIFTKDGRALKNPTREVRICIMWLELNSE
jgi:hypothetical protein